jgi:hypothetical protein
MFPVGSYERLIHEIKNREDSDLPITFGILIADYRQQKCREYIINYLSRFNKISGKYINFYLPGYISDEIYKNDNIISLHNKKYYFNTEIYDMFLEKLKSDFDIDYPYNPILLLVEYSKGHFRFSKKIRFELDMDGSDIKQTGELFEIIFDIAKKEVSITEFKSKLRAKVFKKNIFEDLIKIIDNKYVSTVVDKTKNILTYKLK